MATDPNTNTYFFPVPIKYVLVPCKVNGPGLQPSMSKLNNFGYKKR